MSKSNSELVSRIVDRLEASPRPTDRDMMLSWKIMHLCINFLSDQKAYPSEIFEALEAFGKGAEIDKKYEKLIGESIGKLLPKLSNDYKDNVQLELVRIARSTTNLKDAAINAVGEINKRLNQEMTGMVMSGIRHRLNLAKEILDKDLGTKSFQDRIASAVLYVEKRDDVIPDSLGVVGFLDDDYALRAVLSDHEFDELEIGRLDHWSEQIAYLWDDLPFLIGVSLRRERELQIGWLDRLNSFAAYRHVYERSEKPLVLLQPSSESSPLHLLVTLLGYLLLDAETSSGNYVKELIAKLVPGRVYEIDGKHRAIYRGIETFSYDKLKKPETRLRLEVKKERKSDTYKYEDTSIARRMVLSDDDEKTLTSWTTLKDDAKDTEEPVRKFFDWESVIGVGSISSHIVLVTSKERMQEIFGNVSSNNVNMIKDNLVVWKGQFGTSDVHKGLIWVVPDLGSVIQLVENKESIAAIVVDDYIRIRRDREELPWLVGEPNSQDGIPMIVWTAEGKYPEKTPDFLANAEEYNIPTEHLIEVLTLDDVLDQPDKPSLGLDASGSDKETVQAQYILSSKYRPLDDRSQSVSRALLQSATGDGVFLVVSDDCEQEKELLSIIESYRKALDKSGSLGKRLKWDLLMASRVLRLSVNATPSRWEVLKARADEWFNNTDNLWKRYSYSEGDEESRLREFELKIADKISEIKEVYNSSGKALVKFMEKCQNSDKGIVFDARHEYQREIVRESFENTYPQIEIKLLKEINLCEDWLVFGRLDRTFIRKLLSYNPNSITALITRTYENNWNWFKDGNKGKQWESLLTHISGVPLKSNPTRYSQESRFEYVDDEWVTKFEEKIREKSFVSASAKNLVPCVFLYFRDNDLAMILPPKRQLMLYSNNDHRIPSKEALELTVGDRVIVAVGDGINEENQIEVLQNKFVEAYEEANPRVSKNARSWRRELSESGMTSEEVLDGLKKKGVDRELMTIEGWMDLDRRHPFAPRDYQTTLQKVWQLIGITKKPEVQTGIFSDIRKVWSYRRHARKELFSYLEGRNERSEVELARAGVDKGELDKMVSFLKKTFEGVEVEKMIEGKIDRNWLNIRLSAEEVDSIRQT